MRHPPLEWGKTLLTGLRPSSPLIKPHFNSLDQDFYLDRHQIAQTHKLIQDLFFKPLHPSTRFNNNPSSSSCVIPLTLRQKNKQTNADENISSLAEVTRRKPRSIHHHIAQTCIEIRYCTLYCVRSFLQIDHVKHRQKCILFSFTHVSSANMEEVGFITYTAASHQVAIEMLWLPFCGVVPLYLQSLV